MAITLVTGQPGHGKTQWAIAYARKLAASGRTVYAGNIRGLKYDAAGFVELKDFSTWQDLPDNSVVLWDECYSAIPQRAAGRPVPSHVEALARHRHRGFDFILVAQQPKQLDSFISGLIERHLHVRRKFGSHFVRLKEWDRWERDPDKAVPILTTNWRLDSSVWPLYESATTHTMQRRVPWYVWALPLSVIAVVVAWLGVPMLMIDRAESIAGKTGATAEDDVLEPIVTSSASYALQGFGAAASQVVHAIDVDKIKREAQSLRYSDPLAYMRPRLPAMLWTAPAYDDAPIAPPPRLACMSSPANCNCVAFGNGQSVRYIVDDDLCRVIAREGIYDPTVQHYQDNVVRNVNDMRSGANINVVSGDGRSSPKSYPPRIGGVYKPVDIRAGMD